MFKKLGAFLLFMLSISSYAESDKSNIIIADMSYAPLSATCLDFLKQVSSFYNHSKNGVYLESDMQKFESSLNIIWGIGDSSYIVNNFKSNPPMFFMNTYEECNRKKNIENYWSNYLTIPVLDEEDEYKFSQYFFSSCHDVNNLLINIIKFSTSIENQDKLITDLVNKDERDDYNMSVVFKNYLIGFSQGINVSQGTNIDIGSLISFLLEYCSSRPDDTIIEDVLEYAANNPLLIK